MSHPSQEPAPPLTLTCPDCGATLSGVPDDDQSLCCPAHHRYTLAALLLGQSRRVALLCEEGARLLDEQERLVRQIAGHLWNSQTLVAFRLEGHADKLKETRDVLRTCIQEGLLGSPALTSSTPERLN